MKTIAEMKQMIEDLMKKIGDLRALCQTENRSLSTEERKLVQESLDNIDELEDQITLEERTQRTKKRLDGSSDDDKKLRTPLKPSGVELNTKAQEERDRFTSFGEQLVAVRRACAPGGYTDPRLLNRAASGLNEGTPSDGGFLVQTDFSSTILKEVWGNAVVPSRIQKIGISGNSNGLKMNGLDETSRADGSRAGGIQSYWAAEAAEKTASKPKFRKIELSLNKLIGLCYATDELLDDAAALEGVISEGFREEFDYKITDAIINGTGAGQPLGIMNAGCLVTASAETGQLAATLVYENIVNMWARLKATSRMNSVWVINQDVEPQLHQMSLAVGTGGVPVYMPAGGASASPYSTLFARPVVPIEQCQTLGTTGDIILCDFSKYVGIDKGGLQANQSIHVRFVYDESVFRFVYRFDGQPVLASAITPANGTNTLSHFVALETRS
jgi:HK97 family phage major capsid protein